MSLRIIKEKEFLNFDTMKQQTFSKGTLFERGGTIEIETVGVKDSKETLKFLYQDGKKIIVPQISIDCIFEDTIKEERLLESLERSRRTGKSSSIVVVAEGDKTGKNVFELAEYVEENLPEYDVRVSVLGHMQRGGSPSCFDRVLASRLGVKAVELLLDNKTNLMVGLRDNKVVSTDLEEAIKGGHEINKELLKVSDIMST